MEAVRALLLIFVFAASLGAGVIQPPAAGTTQNANWVFFAWDFTDPGVNGDGQMLLLTFQDLPTLSDSPTIVIGDSPVPVGTTDAPSAVPEPALLLPVGAALLGFRLWRSSRAGRRSPSA
jgi:hypothetical protein